MGYNPGHKPRTLDLPRLTEKRRGNGCEGDLRRVFYWSKLEFPLCKENEHVDQGSFLEMNTPGRGGTGIDGVL
jgi:hypothetical protein